jgi:hypothetical protein
VLHRHDHTLGTETIHGAAYAGHHLAESSNGELSGLIDLEPETEVEMSTSNEPNDIALSNVDLAARRRGRRRP